MRTLVLRDGLYEPLHEHDACGVGFLVNIDGQRRHAVIEQGLQVMVNLTHRGACGCDPETGDGCGMLIQLPHRLFLEEAERLGFALPEPGAYGVGMAFLPQDAPSREACEAIINTTIAEEGQTLLGWRDVPRNSAAIGWLARRNEPVIRQVFIGRAPGLDIAAFERKLFVIRRTISTRVDESDLPGKKQMYFASMSARTIVYKGFFVPEAMDRYYEDLSIPLVESALAIVHQRYSTNTLPTWPLAHPFRFLAHNGEINTLRGNINMMCSREHHFASPLFGPDVKKVLPSLTPGASDSAIFDNAFELLVRGGRSVDHAMMMMIPEPWSGHESMSDEKKAFYEFHAAKMEPWDGPASIAFTDGVRIGAVLDRNGLRPSRYWVTDDRQVIMASEAGVLDIPQEKIVRKGRLEPGRMFLIDTEEQRIVEDEEIKMRLAKRQPYRVWLDTYRVLLPEKPKSPNMVREETPLTERLQIFGYTREDEEILIAPMAADGREPIGSMGNDTALAVLSKKPQLLFNYFKQLFAQVTNPAIDPIREEIVMSLEMDLGREGNLLGEDPLDCRRLHIQSPILTNAQLAYIKALDRPGLKTAVLSTLFAAHDGPAAMAAALDRLCSEAETAVDAGASLLVLSDRGVGRDAAPMPSLLAVGGVHQHLVRVHKRTECGLIMETGEAREVMHCALLTGYGAGAVNPYLAYEIIDDLLARGVITEKNRGQAHKNYIKALEKGLLKVMSKIGISTQQSYHCAQIFEAVGLNNAVIDRCFAGTASRIEGIGMAEIARETLMRHAMAYPPRRLRAPELDVGGAYRWRRRGEFHQWNPKTVAMLQHAARSGEEKT